MKTINLKSLRIIFAILFAFPLFFSCNREEDYEDLEYYKSDKKNDKLPEKATDLEDLCTDCVRSCIQCPYY